MTNDGPDTDELVRRAAAQDLQATEQLMARHRDRLDRMVSVRMDQRLRRRVDPADIVQETMVLAIQRLPDYLRDRPIAFYPWLRQLAWELMVDSYRKHIAAQRRSIHREVDSDVGFACTLTDQSVFNLADVLIAQQSTPSQKLVRDQMRQQVQHALDQIAAGYRELLVMRYLEELSTREIADCLNISEGAVKMRHMRALRQLSSALSSSDFARGG